MKQNLKYVKCPSFIFKLKMNEKGLGDGNDKLMLFMLMSLGDKSVNYNQEELGRLIGCSPMAAGKILKRLEANGFISIIKGSFDPVRRKRYHNTFELNMEYILSFADDKDYFYSDEETTDNQPVSPESNVVIPTPAPEEDCALEPTEIAKNEVCMQQFELDPIVDGEIDEDDCRYKEYMAGLNKDKTKEDEDMIEQKVIDRFKDIRYNSPEYWRMMREVVDPLPNCQKDNVIKELNEYFRAA